MNEAGVLGRFIPDFGKIVAMMQFNMYHHFTVDEHLLRSIGVMSRIENGELTQELPARIGHVRTGRIRAGNPAAGAVCGPVPARYRQGATGGSFDRRRKDCSQAVPPVRADSRADGYGGMAGGDASRHVHHRTEPGSVRPAHDCRFCGTDADARADAPAAGADGLRYHGRRSRCVERLERAACCARCITRPNRC